MDGHIVDFRRVPLCFVKIVHIILRQGFGFFLALTRDIRNAGFVIVKLFFTLDGIFVPFVGQIKAVCLVVARRKVNGGQLDARFALDAPLAENVNGVGFAHIQLGGCFHDHHRAVGIFGGARLAVRQILRFQLAQLRQTDHSAFGVRLCRERCRNHSDEHHRAKQNRNCRFEKTFHSIPPTKKYSNKL